jgi:chorismate mutase/prephenate dehydrogenase
MDELPALRREMRDVDRALLALVARRLRTAERIGRAKARRGLPMRNFEVEAEAIGEARKLCRRYGIDQELGEQLLRALIDAAVKVQEGPR